MENNQNFTRAKLMSVGVYKKDKIKKRKSMKGATTEIDLYFMVIPGLLVLILFAYIPMCGLTLAFQNYRLGKDFFSSPWVGFDHFKHLFTDPSTDFYRILWNTININFLKLIFSFPAPILLALALNEITFTPLKKVLQTITYLPHFLSWVVAGGIMINIFSSSFGLLATVWRAFGWEPIKFLVEDNPFIFVLVSSEIWKTIGWNSIIYLAALVGINPDLYEAAAIDGAGKLRRIIHISIPGIVSTIMIVLILNIGNLMRGGFEQILMLYSPPVYDVADTIPTYIYRYGLQLGQYSYTTAVGLFQSLVSFLLVFGTNTLSKKLGGNGVW